LPYRPSPFLSITNTKVSEPAYPTSGKPGNSQNARNGKFAIAQEIAIQRRNARRPTIWLSRVRCQEAMRAKVHETTVWIGYLSQPVRASFRDRANVPIKAPVAENCAGDRAELP
jgi:hypothetical protein